MESRTKQNSPLLSLNRLYNEVCVDRDDSLVPTEPTTQFFLFRHIRCQHDPRRHPWTSNVWAYFGQLMDAWSCQLALYEQLKTACKGGKLFLSQVQPKIICKHILIRINNLESWLRGDMYALGSSHWLDRPTFWCIICLIQQAFYDFAQPHFTAFTSYLESLVWRCHRAYRFQVQLWQICQPPVPLYPVHLHWWSVRCSPRCASHNPSAFACSLSVQQMRWVRRTEVQSQAYLTKRHKRKV